MYLIGLTGGIASGKTVVAHRLAERGAVHVDADQLAREVVEPGTPGLAAIAERFGSGVLAADGSLDRAALGAVIFSDAEARLDLNGITHPAIKQLTKKLFVEAEERDPRAVVVYDVPLLVEAMKGDGYHQFDLVVVVNASTETRMSRLIELRGLSREEATHRLSSQATDTDRLAIADVVIDSNGSLDDTLRQADALWERVRSRA
ncbi:dephospho-CoA kinase [Glaciihabitans sp. UYNi722]|uniref:dephospho-CoA kinase n=1 Tax=Glaciihabitans sp. UYNi722 TaxID=3156344 RepID=UPI003393F9CB